MCLLLFALVSSGPTSTDRIWLNSTIVITHYVNDLAQLFGVTNIILIEMVQISLRV